MKKKILLFFVISIILITSLAFAGCSSEAPFQKQISQYSPWKQKTGTETLIYSVTNSQDETMTGTYTTTIKKCTKESIDIPTFTITDFTGYYLTSELVINGEVVQKAYVACTMNFEPKYSYTEYVNENKTLKAQYETKKYNYTVIEDGVETSDSISHKAYDSQAYFDNNQIYMILRTMAKASKTALSINVPQVSLGSLDTVSLTVSQQTTTETVLGNEMECFKATINTTRTFPGKFDELSCKIAKNTIANIVDYAIVYITEGNISYNLISASLN